MGSGAGGRCRARDEDGQCNQRSRHARRPIGRFAPPRQVSSHDRARVPEKTKAPDFWSGASAFVSSTPTLLTPPGQAVAFAVREL